MNLPSLRPVAHRLDMRDLHRPVERQFGVEPAKAVVLGREGHVVIGRQVFQMDPALPGGGQRAVMPGGLQLVQHRADLLPGRQIGVRVDPGRRQRVAVHPQHRRGRVERQRQHLAVR